ncbi:E3 ubiquitin-protein ligase [Aspergillus ibericus CBS 121593]|uniref:RBR-type E3 ubiquitin transferase n=1 Tax=Aspergillus ibericus CBS 121593 TaxID=1448316 RepID=A0A395GPJ7_9EURO|nr:hypothetical protein BO80DRAFT_496342 [Aspergillus ibericus CBS 121593]RAK97440.1 hypothetical protein BO80DRAFT_496342 [Aspergillus ibericus CBS 121593]
MDISCRSILDDEIDALRQQIEEIRHHNESRKGKSRADGSPPDHELAVEAYLEEIKMHITLLLDKKLAASIARAVDSDGQLIAALTQEESGANNDRQLAIRLHGNPSLEQLTVNDSTEYFRVREPSDSEDECIAGPSMTYTQRQEKAIEKSQSKIQCCVCYDSYHAHKIHRLSCKHTYCSDCLKDLFLRATKDQSLFPPRCCRQPISLDVVQTALSETELDEFKCAELEFSTTDRTYCSNLNCGKFIPPSHINGERAQCPYCNTFTCAMCKNAFHYDDCPEDTATQATLALAANEGWQRCFSCRAIVALGIGCYHITCKCRAQFCYLCGMRWKTCTCERWAEDHLVVRAEEVVDREAVEPLAPRVRQLRIEQMQEDLRGNHECEHPGKFERIFGTGRRRFQCEICDDRHRKYILQCRRCHIRVCEDCRRNRI